jgi:ABC-type sugar transport system ATPase subunit
MPLSFLDVSRISFAREGKTVLKNISFAMAVGQKMVIAGETGSGKSTLLKIIAGLEQATDGAVWMNGEKIKGPAEQLVPGHPQIAYLSQHFELPKFLRVEQVLEYANQLTPSAAARIFSICKINHLLKRKTDELSGGEKQRIAIARLLIQQPQVLLLDEPYSHLDMTLKATLKSIVDDIGRKLKISCILVSHDPDDTLSWADEILVLKNGQITQRGTAQELYRNPKNEYVAGLFGTFSLLDKKMIRQLGISTKENKFFARPEDLLVTKGTRGRVVAVKYFGNHYLLSVETSKQTLLVRSEKKWQEGNLVNLSLTPSAKKRRV